MAFLALDHVQIAMAAGGEDAARGFYGGVLGMHEVPKPEPMRANGGAWFRSGGVELHLGAEPDFEPARKAHPALRVDDLDEVAERCEAAGFAPLWDERYPGVRRFYVADPFGNRIEILQLPAAEQAPRPDLTSRPFDLAAEHTIDVPPATVYEAWTERFDRWFAAPGATWMRAEPGAPYFFEVHAGGQRHPHHGRFLRLEPGRVVEMTWVTAGTRGAETVLAVHLTPRDAGTHLRLTHEGFPDAEARDAHANAWPAILAQLAGRLGRPE